MRILIVEDDERIVSFMKRGLEAEDFEVDVAPDKSNTFDLVNTHVYDLVIIDIFLGPDDGLELCQTLRQGRLESPILIMTAKGTPDTELASKEAGADAYLPKPFAFDELIATIVRLCKTPDPNDGPPRPSLATPPIRINRSDCVYER